MNIESKIGFKLTFDLHLATTILVLLNSYVCERKNQWWYIGVVGKNRTKNKRWGKLEGAGKNLVRLDWNEDGIFKDIWQFDYD